MLCLTGYANTLVYATDSIDSLTHEQLLALTLQLQEKNDTLNQSLTNAIHQLEIYNEKSKKLQQKFNPNNPILFELKNIKPLNTTNIQKNITENLAELTVSQKNPMKHSCNIIDNTVTLCTAVENYQQASQAIFRIIEEYEKIFNK